MSDTRMSRYISPGLQKVAELARQAPDLSFLSLAHHITPDLLREACRRTRRDGAVGVDGQTASAYAESLDENLGSLLDRAKSGRYRAPPVRRVNIPKGDGKSTRPIGIPTYEDKVLQRAVVMVLEAVYEQDFLPCSYGFRPGRSAHQALEDLWSGLMRMGGGWVLEVDIKSFFDDLVHKKLRELLNRRVRDGVLHRLIAKWLHAGVLTTDGISRSDRGTPQGGVISPLLANVYLHEVLDVWFEETVKPRLRGDAFLIRYADDFVIAFQQETDARELMEVLPARMAEYGLTLHPEKTRLLDFRRPPGGASPGNFDLLGFRHFWSKSRKNHWIVKRMTAPDRFRRSLRRLHEWCRGHRHWPIEEQHRAISRSMRGHYAYFGITGNSLALQRLVRGVERIWLSWLRRRSQRAHRSWAWYAKMRRRYPLPRPIAIHSIYHAASP